MRVLLIYSNRSRMMEPAPPIGLSYVATAARQAGHEVRFLDLMISRQPLTELRRDLAEFKPEGVGLSVRNIDNVVAQRTSWHLDEVGELGAAVGAGSKARPVLGDPAIGIRGDKAFN